LNSPVSEEAAGGKRVSWVELYFDLIFVLAVGQTTHIMMADPNWSGFGRALGLFVPLWWTWIGFVVLCNRHYDDQISQRLLVLAGTLPCAVAAVETHAAAAGHLLAFAFALAAARLLLALAFAFTAEQATQVALGYGLSTAVFAASAFAPSPWCYVLWASPSFRRLASCCSATADRPARVARTGPAGQSAAPTGPAGNGERDAGPARAGPNGCAPCSSRRPIRLAGSTPGTWPSASAA
jgi:Bacterial low temperature requirement A protein (LtrA)